MTPRARDIMIRVRVIGSKRDALDAAQRGAIDPDLYRERDTPDAATDVARDPEKTNNIKKRKSATATNVASGAKASSRAILILPNDLRALRRLLAGRVYRLH